MCCSSCYKAMTKKKKKKRKAKIKKKTGDR